jgi:hypothetical protein
VTLRGIAPGKPLRKCLDEVELAEKGSIIDRKRVKVLAFRRARGGKICHARKNWKAEVYRQTG